MPVETPLAHPYHVEGGHADFLLKTDMMRRNPLAYMKLAQQYNAPVTVIDILESLGLTSMRDSKAHQSPWVDFYTAHDDDRYFAIGSVVTPQSGAGDPVTVALATSEMKTQDGRRFSRPRKSESIVDKSGNNWKIIEKITNTGSNPHQLVLQPQQSTTAATFAANDRFFIIGPRFAEATGQPKGLRPDYGMYSNRFAIFKETDLTSGTNMTTSQTQLFSVPGLSQWAYVDGIESAEFRHELNKSKAIIFEEIGDNVFDYSPDFDEDVLDHSTEGLISSIETQGTTQTWDVSAGYDLDDLRRITSKFRNMRVPSGDILLLQGSEVASAVQAALVDFLGTDNTDQYIKNKYLGQRYKGGERFSADDLYLHMGFKGVNFDNYNIVFREANELSGLYGDDNYTGGVDYGTWQFGIPLYVQKDAKNQKISMPSLQLLHRGQGAGGYNRRNEIWQTGGAGPIRKTDEWDVMRTFLRSEICLMLFAGKFSIIQKGGTSDS